MFLWETNKKEVVVVSHQVTKTAKIFVSISQSEIKLKRDWLVNLIEFLVRFVFLWETNKKEVVVVSHQGTKTTKHMSLSRTTK